MSMNEKYVIVGGGLAGATAVQTLREEGAEGPITLLCGEQELPYIRPPLSKDYLKDEVPRDSVFVHDQAWYDEHNVEVLLDAPVGRVRPEAREVILTDGRIVDYSQVLLATGSSARILDVPGADLEGVLSLRTLGDAERIKSALVDGQRMVVVGAGWIGLEVASAAREAGLDVVVVEVGDHPLERVLGPTVGGLFTDLHVQHGVSMLMRSSVAELTGRAGRVTGARLESGVFLPADVVVVGVGAEPNVEVAAASDIPVKNGVLVDEYLATGLPGVYAAGDIAHAFHRHYARHIRVEHWDNAKQQGAAAARNMLGQRAEYDRLPFFYSDQYDLGLEYTGWSPPGGFDKVVLRGDVNSFRFIAFWISRHRVVAAMNVNTWDVRPQLVDRIRSGAEVDNDALQDADAELAVLAGAG